MFGVNSVHVPDFNLKEETKSKLECNFSLTIQRDMVMEYWGRCLPALGWTKCVLFEEKTNENNRILLIVCKASVKKRN